MLTSILIAQVHLTENGKYLCLLLKFIYNKEQPLSYADQLKQKLD